VVTGAGSGIGRATAEAIVDQGGSVVAVDLTADALAWIAGRSDVVACAGSVVEPDVNEAAVALAFERFGRLDALVLNAGIPMSGDLMSLPLAELDRAMQVNVNALVLGMRAAVPAMRLVGGGRIVITASTSGLGADPGRWAYNASKGAAVNLGRAMALDLAADAITVNVVCPGPTETGMTMRLQSMPEVKAEMARRIPLQRWGTPAEVAAVIAFLAGPTASFITGAVIPVDGGITASTGQFSPRPRVD
jgi:meso-butanediol dehydrogenase / (S,S)-butanediol dehydrogenase / diacetyl reductase